MLSGPRERSQVLVFAGKGLKLAPAVASAAAIVCSGAADAVLGPGTKQC